MLNRGARAMEQKDLWTVFQTTGRVEDYLRYRGVSLAAGDNVVQEEGDGYGKRPKTASDDRRPGNTGL